MAKLIRNRMSRSSQRVFFDQMAEERRRERERAEAGRKRLFNFTISRINPNRSRTVIERGVFVGTSIESAQRKVLDKSKARSKRTGVPLTQTSFNLTEGRLL